MEIDNINDKNTNSNDSFYKFLIDFQNFHFLYENHSTENLLHFWNHCIIFHNSNKLLEYLQNIFSTNSSFSCSFTIFSRFLFVIEQFCSTFEIEDFLKSILSFSCFSSMEFQFLFATYFEKNGSYSDALRLLKPFVYNMNDDVNNIDFISFHGVLKKKLGLYDEASSLYLRCCSIIENNQKNNNTSNNIHSKYEISHYQLLLGDIKRKQGLFSFSFSPQ